MTKARTEGMLIGPLICVALVAGLGAALLIAGSILKYRAGAETEALIAEMEALDGGIDSSLSSTHETHQRINQSLQEINASLDRIEDNLDTTIAILTDEDRSEPD